MFRRRENKKVKASKKILGSVGGASDIARSIRESKKLQVHSKFWHNVLFLVAVALILFALLYVY